jgi:hypothetical protein
MRPVDKRIPNDPEKIRSHWCQDFTKQFDLPVNQQDLKTLYKMRPAEEPASVSLIILKLGYDGNSLVHPYKIEKYEDFANRPFDELYELMSTLKYKLDRSYKDNLEGSHIG